MTIDHLIIESLQTWGRTVGKCAVRLEFANDGHHVLCTMYRCEDSKKIDSVFVTNEVMQ